MPTMKITRLIVQLFGVVLTLSFSSNAGAYYVPYVGRFLSRDSAGYSDGPNEHQYVRGNPINRIDPMGLSSENIKDTIEGVILRRFSGLTAHEWIEIDGSRRGFYPTDKINRSCGGLGALFDFEGGKWVDEETVKIPIQNPFTGEIKLEPRDKILVSRGKYYEWKVVKKSSGEMKFGKLKGTRCSCVKKDEIKAALKDYTNPGPTIYGYYIVGKNCVSRAHQALEQVCAQGGEKTHSPVK